MRDKEFWKKVQRAKRVEREICRWLRENMDKTANIPREFSPEYDIIGQKIGRVEVKEDSLAHITGNYAIEIENYQGKQSGISLTAAKYFIIVDWENVCIMATSVLKDIVNRCKEKKTIPMGGERLGGGRVKGHLIPKERILNNPLVTVIPRWFPTWEGVGA